jgi:hypothetical protein
VEVDYTLPVKRRLRPRRFEKWRTAGRRDTFSIMKSFVLLLVGAGLVATAPAAAKPREQPVAKPAEAEADTYCDVYGEGFQRMPGSDVCVKVSVSVTTTVGFSGGSRAGKPSQ